MILFEQENILFIRYDFYLICGEYIQNVVKSLGFNSAETHVQYNLPRQIYFDF